MGITDPQRRELLAKQWRPLAYLLARRWAEKTRLPEDELQGEAIVGLVSALNLFDDTRNAQFQTYAYLAIRDYLGRYVSRMSAQKRFAKPVPRVVNTQSEEDWLREAERLLEVSHTIQAAKEIVKSDDWELVWQRYALGIPRNTMARRLGYSKQGLLLRERRVLSHIRKTLEVV